MFGCHRSILALGLIGWGMGAVVGGGMSSAVATPVSDSMPTILPVGSEPQPQPSPVRWEGDQVHFGDVIMDSATKTVMMTGWVNQTDGPIEVLVCGAKGKVHEAVLVAPVNALDLQSACLLAGMKGGEPMAAFGEGPPKGSPVEVWVEWKDSETGEARRARAESFAWNLRTQAPVPDGAWTFTGSMFKDGEFKAFAEESLVVSYWDPYAIINITDPCGGDDEVLTANARAIPPYGTAVKILLKPVASFDAPTASAGAEVPPAEAVLETPAVAAE